MGRTEETATMKLSVGLRRAWRRGLSPNATRVLSVTVFIVVWELIGRQMNPILMSHPTAIALAFIDMLLSGELVKEFLNSMRAFLAGFAASVVLGVIVGMLMGTYRRFEYAVDPFINALYATPNVALIPLLILWVGLGLWAKICNRVPGRLLSYRGGHIWRGEEHQRLPGGESDVPTVRRNGSFFKRSFCRVPIPFIVTGIRLAVGRGIVGIVVAEFFTAISGLGGLIILYSNRFETDRMFVPIIVLALMGVFLTEAVKVIERKVAAWKETERAAPR